MDEQKEHIVFVKMLNSSFIRKDQELLARRYTIHELYYPVSKGFPFLWELFLSVFRLIWWYRKAKRVYIWFADYHAFLPILLGKLFRVRSYLFIGGYDAANIPELQYGSFSRPVRAAVTRFAVRNADYVLPVAESLGKKLQKRVGEIKGELITVPFGFNPANWYCDTPKEQLVVTVAIFENWQRIRIKGLDFYQEVARSLPEYQFVIIGSTDAGAELLDPPDNLQLVGKTPLKELRHWYSRAAVYAQFSLSEGLPNAVCESMLCECVPVGTEVGGIPSIIGDTGFLLKSQELDEAVLAIREAMEAVPLRKKARERILNRYPLNQRAKIFDELSA